MNNKNSVSIIVPAFKEEEFIEETLKNYLEVFSAAKIEFEIIVIIDKVNGDKTDQLIKKKYYL